MKHLTILLLCGFLIKSSFSQSNLSGLHFGKYEGIELIYFKYTSDTSSKVDRMNETWGKKTLTLDSNGTFLLEFPVPHPTTAVGLKRSAKGHWVRINDTLVLNSFHPYSDFIKVNERKVYRPARGVFADGLTAWLCRETPGILRQPYIFHSCYLLEYIGIGAIIKPGAAMRVKRKISH